MLLRPECLLRFHIATTCRRWTPSLISARRRATREEEEIDIHDVGPSAARYHTLILPPRAWFDQRQPLIAAEAPRRGGGNAISRHFVRVRRR